MFPLRIAFFFNYELRMFELRITLDYLQITNANNLTQSLVIENL